MPAEMFSNVLPFYFGLNTPRTEHFEGLKDIPHQYAESCNADRSMQLLLICPAFHRGRYRREVIDIGQKKRGSRTVPFETPDSTQTDSEDLPSTTTFRFYWSENFESNLEFSPNSLMVKFV